jgi:hypothetical protein
VFHIVNLLLSFPRKRESSYSSSYPSPGLYFPAPFFLPSAIFIRKPDKTQIKKKQPVVIQQAAPSPNPTNYLQQATAHPLDLVQQATARSRCFCG